MKSSTTPRRFGEDEGGETAFLPIPRLANAFMTSARPVGLRAETAVRMPSRAWVKVGWLGVS